MITPLPAADDYRRTFGAAPAVIAAAPGRVNLIGEHTDYNEGFVLPAAIDRSVCVAAGPGEPGILAVSSQDRGPVLSLRTSDLLRPRPPEWALYVAGVYDLLVPATARTQGIRLRITADLPPDAGLSSSAALETAVCMAVAHFLELPLTAEECITLCRRAEEEYAGVRCGIMDQTVVVHARAGHALFLDCRSLAAEHVPIPADLALVICHSGVRRSLLASPYNTRREECALAVRLLRQDRPELAALRDLTVEELPAAMRRLPPPLHRRVRHVVTENCRVREAVAALRSGDRPRLGKMLYDSHMSLRDQYDAGRAELDAIVDLCAEQEGVVGARMTGAGFGGAAIALVHTDAADALRRRLECGYPAATGRTPLILRCLTADGAAAQRL